MIQTQNFEIKPNASIKNGQVSYTADTQTGKLTYQGQVTVKVAFFITKTQNFSGEYAIDASLLKSDLFKKVGDSMMIGDVVFLTTSVAPGQTQVLITVKGQDMHGTGVVDTTNEIIKIKQILATAKVPLLGTLQAEADPVQTKAKLKFPYWLKKAFRLE